MFVFWCWGFAYLFNFLCVASDFMLSMTFSGEGCWKSRWPCTYVPNSNHQVFENYLRISVTLISSVRDQERAGHTDSTLREITQRCLVTLEKNVMYWHWLLFDGRHFWEKHKKGKRLSSNLSFHFMWRLLKKLWIDFSPLFCIKTNGITHL